MSFAAISKENLMILGIDRLKPVVGYLIYVDAASEWAQTEIREKAIPAVKDPQSPATHVSFVNVS